MTDRASINAAATVIQDRYGRLDVLINNAAAYADWAETATAADLSQSRPSWTSTCTGPGA